MAAMAATPDADINRWGGTKMYFNTENDLVDVAAPQWGPSMQASLNWPLAFINNYLMANGTATMLCPAIHSWSMNLVSFSSTCPSKLIVDLML